ncbi:hypothetical protein Tco_0356200 [Tanacetum coccineum]
MAYLCLHFIRNYEDIKSNTPYPGDIHTPYSIYGNKIFWKISNVVPTPRNTDTPYPSLSIRLIMTKVIKEEFENLGFLEINDDSFACNTQLGTLYDEFNRLSRIDNDLFIYEIEVPKPCLCDKQTSNLTHNDLKEYEWKMSYEECEKIYAKAVIFINKRLVRLVDGTVEQ